MVDEAVVKGLPSPPSGRGRGNASVKLFEIVDASGWTADNDDNDDGEKRKNNTISDLRPLLLLMDIGSCASAEKHTGVNCVTVGMGDVVIEHYPRIGELLEVRASPVDTGSTSLNIAVTVLAHGCRDRDESNNKNKKNDDNDNASDDEYDDEYDDDEYDDDTAEGCTKRVCEAFFTYVTTRGPKGEKRFVPPLVEGSDTTTTWQRTLARFRKQLIRSEQAFTKHPPGYSIPLSECVFESSEVVLPSHQNHMEHLFGGIVMGWMCKSVVAACVVATGLPPNRFRIRAIQRVDFPKGADVSDHVFLRPRITAIFEGGRAAEVEVMVGKRGITDNNNNENNNDNSGGEETTMNFGYFYVSGASYRDEEGFDTDQDESNRNKRLPTSIAPFARLLRNSSSPAASSPTAPCLLWPTNRDHFAMAHKRKAAMMARRHLLSGLGAPTIWHPYLEEQAPLLTILSVLRLCENDNDNNHEHERSPAPFGPESSVSPYGGRKRRTRWMAVDDPGGMGDPEESGDHRRHHSRRYPCHQPIRIEWMPGNALGHPNTVLVRGKTVISRTKPGNTATGGSSSSSRFLRDVYGSLWNKRLQWDPSLLNVCVLEQKQEGDSASAAAAAAASGGKTAPGEASVYWDVAEYHMETSGNRTSFCLLRAGSYFGGDGRVLSAASGDTNGENEEDAARTTTPTIGVMASRSVRHAASSSRTSVLPSGWLLRTLGGGTNNDAGNSEPDDCVDAYADADTEHLEITFVAEMDFDALRRSGTFGAKGVTDDYIVCFLASMIRVWLTNLASFDHAADHN